MRDKEHDNKLKLLKALIKLKNIKAMSVLDKMELPCERIGCSFSCKGSAIVGLYSHVRSCLRQTVCCRYCGQCINKAIMQLHQSALCPKRRVTCQHEFCPRLLSIREKKAHELSCMFAEIDCPNKRCNQVFAKKDLHKHLEICGYVRILCAICERWVTRLKFDTHKCHENVQAVPPTYTGSGMFQCKNSGCSFIGSSQEMSVHHINCRYRDQECWDCGANMANYMITVHAKTCKGLLKCKQCGRKLCR